VSIWSGPLAATICSVPPYTGFPEFAVELDDDDPPHAARLMPATAAMAPRT
jgi:hypothetical protein